MARMRSGFAVIGDTQHLPGYSLLLTVDPSADHLTVLDWERRTSFLFDLALLGIHPNWYLWAWCRMREAPRAFRLDRIRGAVMYDEVAPDRGIDPALLGEAVE